MVEFTSVQRVHKHALETKHGDPEAGCESPARQVRLTISGQKPICCSIASVTVHEASSV
jgi:hypothetical protein